MNSQPFSYDVLKSIIGHMDVFKRAALTEFPELKAAEQKADLYLDNLKIERTSISINRGTFSSVKPEELSYRDDKMSLYWRRLTKKREPEELLRKVIDYYLANRGIVKVRFLDVEVPYEKGNLPDGLKMDCQDLKLGTGHQHSNIQMIESVAPFLTNRPLETFSFQSTRLNDPIFDHDWVLNAHYLKISFNSNTSILPQLIKLKNSRILVEDRYFKMYEFVSMVDCWLVRCPPIGTQFSLVNYDLFYYLIKPLRDQFSAVNGEIADPESVCPISCVTIQMKSGDELNVFEDWVGKWLRMEVMQRGTSRNVQI